MSEIKLIDPIKDTSSRLARIGHQVTVTKKLSYGTQLKTSKKLSVTVFDTGRLQFQGIGAREVETKYYEELHRVGTEKVKLLPPAKPKKCVTFIKRSKKPHPEFTVRCPIGKTEDGKWKNVLKIEAAFNELDKALEWARIGRTTVVIKAYNETGVINYMECQEQLRDTLLMLEDKNDKSPMLIYKRSPLNTTRYGEFQIGITAKGVIVNTIEECLND